MSDFKVSSATLVAAFDVEIRAALVAGATLIARDAAAHAPVLQKGTRYRVPGALRNAIGVESRSAAAGKFKVSVGIDENSAFYGRFQELGFHTRARRGQSAARANAGSVRFIPGLHFMTRALDANKAAAIGLVAARVKAVIDKANK